MKKINPKLLVSAGGIQISNPELPESTSGKVLVCLTNNLKRFKAVIITTQKQLSGLATHDGLPKNWWLVDVKKLEAVRNT